MKKIALAALIFGSVLATPAVRSNVAPSLVSNVSCFVSNMAQSNFTARILQNMYVPSYHPCSLGVVCGGVAADAAYQLILKDLVKKHSWVIDTVLRSTVVATALTLPYAL